MYLVVSAVHRVRLRKVKKIGKYQDLAQNQQNVWIAKVRVVPLILVEFGTIPKTLEVRLDYLEIRESLGII